MLKVTAWVVVVDWVFGVACGTAESAVSPSGSNQTEASRGFPVNSRAREESAGSGCQIYPTLMFAVSRCRREYSFARDRAFQLHRR